MTLAFKLKYGKLKDKFGAIAAANQVEKPPIDNDWGGKRIPMPCETLVFHGNKCGHKKSSHRQGEFACMAEGCPCRGFTFSGRESN